MSYNFGRAKFTDFLRFGSRLKGHIFHSYPFEAGKIRNKTIVLSSSNITNSVLLTTFALSPLIWYNTINNDALNSPGLEDSINVYYSITPFPLKYGPPDRPLKATYTILGYGIRSVTFLKFKVYALGIYACTEDINLIQKVFNSDFLSEVTGIEKTASLKEMAKKALSDPAQSRVLINKVLSNGMRLVAKIKPIRDTDLNHLKDGLVKSISNHPDSKDFRAELKRGLHQLKTTLRKKRGKVPKDDEFIIELQANGNLNFYHYIRKNGVTVEIGTVTEPIIGRLLFGQYLSGPRPLSEDTRESVANKIVNML
ncbi:chalcone isomerase domain-containing protein Ecym_5153 [Eremothecium cymbalariae DBVPG|uniref:Altered inheritance of mitochondria protein 18, mitochondrial n=1 Tax=Eremothecium cymbalariae (strain CBS 270.75 / DBVPG 7215 / KCTC 17166 / NRRL Y-17582) TaxID=931890 RepID=I6NCY7_ERECY|nr:hypothetical protein Ecym_5153 [Eremothecium cymbalariae DBVPG\